jgi:anti-sigma factor RsiW
MLADKPRLMLQKVLEMLSCQQLAERTSEFLDGQLSPWARFQMRVHLLFCQHCQRYVEQMQRTIDLLRRLPAGSPSHVVEEQLLEAFQKERSPARLTNGCERQALRR